MKTASIENTWAKFESLVKSQKSTSDCMLELLKSLESKMNRDTYIQLSKLDYTVEIDEVREHLIKELSISPLPEKIKGIWFGINTFSEKADDQENYGFYMSGSNHFTYDNNEWACEIEYETNSDIFFLGILNDIISIIKKDKKIFDLGNWIFPISYYSFIISNCFKNNQFRELITKNNNEIGITIGYDDGDYLNLKIE